jgi:hypothetical protein
MLRLTFPTGDLIIDHRSALAPVQSLQCLDSEDEVRRLLLIALNNPTALDALRRFFARWNSEAWRVNVIKDRTLVERVARMTVNGSLAAFVVYDKRTLRVAHMASKLATGKLMQKGASRGAASGAAHVAVKPPEAVKPVPHAETRLAATSPVAATQKAAATQYVRSLPIELRIEEVLRRTPPYLPQAMRADFMALLSPEYLAITVGVLAAWAVSHAFGIGFIIDALLVIAGAVLFGMAIVDVARKLHQCLELAATAQTEEGLDESAKLLADVVGDIGVAAFVALVTHGASRTVSSAAKGKPPPREPPTKEPPKPLPRAEKPLTASVREIMYENVRRMRKGKRPDPRTYIPKNEIDAHLAKFDKGAVVIMTKSTFNKVSGSLKGAMGRPDAQFVMPKSEMDAMMARTKGNPRLLEQELGLPPGALKKDGLVRLDISDPRSLNLRMPSGNEAGANDLWQPGGKLPNGGSEAVVDQLPPGSFSVSDL